jgi:hypothetical protein
MDGATLTQKVQDEFEIASLILMMTAVGDDEKGIDYLLLLLTVP